MTEKLYLITEAQRALFKKVIGAAEGFHFVADRAMIIEADQVMQSLPMVDSEPCNEDLATDIEAIDAMYRGSPTYEHDAYYMRDAAAKLVRKGYSIFASPQALTKISADDVTDEMQAEISNQRTVYLSKKCVAAVVNIYVEMKK